MTKPTLIEKPNLFTYLRHYNNWLEYERVSARTYTPMEQLTTVMECMEKDPNGRFDKALANLRLKKQLHQNLLKNDTTGNLPFPPQLLLEQLPYTIMNEYQPEERVTLFDTTEQNSSDDDSNTAIVHRFVNNKQRDARPSYKSSNYSSNNWSQQDNGPKMRSRINKFCPTCGTYGHDIATNGCDFTACLLKSMDYIKQNPHKLKNVLDLHYKYQGQRRRTLQQKGNTSSRFQTMARKKNLTYGPQVKLLMDVVGDTVDELMLDETEDIADSSILDLIPDTSDNENFQDTQENDE